LLYSNERLVNICVHSATLMDAAESEMF
jgi:hypothetical protein